MKLLSLFPQAAAAAESLKRDDAPLFGEATVADVRLAAARFRPPNNDASNDSFPPTSGISTRAPSPAPARQDSVPLLFCKRGSLRSRQAGLSARFRPFKAKRLRYEHDERSSDGRFPTRTVRSPMPTTLIFSTNDAPPHASLYPQHMEKNDLFSSFPSFSTTLRFVRVSASSPFAVSPRPIPRTCRALTFYLMKKIEFFRVTNNNAHKHVTKLTKAHRQRRLKGEQRARMCLILPAVPVFVPILFNKIDMIYKIGTN